MSATVDRDGRWSDETVAHDEAPDGESDAVDNDDTRGLGLVILRPYDDSLTYSTATSCPRPASSARLADPR
ncbi:hypothetical protein ACFQX7_37100 [Luedemannella flava]